MWYLLPFYTLIYLFIYSQLMLLPTGSLLNNLCNQFKISKYISELLLLLLLLFNLEKKKKLITLLCKGEKEIMNRKFLKEYVLLTEIYFPFLNNFQNLMVTLFRFNVDRFFLSFWTVENFTGNVHFGWS